MRRYWVFGMFVLFLTFVIVLFTMPALADQGGQGHHKSITGKVSKIKSGMLFVKTDFGLRPRTISPAKADRVGLHDVRIGEEVVFWLDEGAVLVDAHKNNASEPRHQLIAGSLQYADQYWQEIKLATPEGTRTFEVDSLAGSKLSAFQEGASVIVELDDANVMIDIHRTR
jgi:hypothetical protein